MWRKLGFKRAGGIAGYFWSVELEQVLFRTGKIPEEWAETSKAKLTTAV